MARRSGGDMLPVKLPPNVIDRLSKSGVPRTATDIRRAEGEEMSLTTYGLEASVRRLRAERELYEEAARLDAVRGEAISIEDLRIKNSGLEQIVREQAAEIDQLRADMAKLTARDAMAVSGEGTKQ